MFCLKKFIFLSFFLLFSLSANASNHLKKYLSNWSNCDLSSYSLLSKKGTISKGKDVFIINGKKKKVTLKQIRYDLRANLDSKNGYSNKICPYFSYIETFYKDEKLFTISILSTTLENTTVNNIPHINVIEKHTYYQNFAKYTQANLDGLGIIDNGIVSQYMVFNVDEKKILQINKIKFSENKTEFPYLFVNFKTKSKKILSNRSDITLIDNEKLKELLSNKFSAFDNVLNNHLDVLFSKSDFDLLEDSLDEIGYVRYQTRD
jgi:hypothetical protein